MAWHAAIVAVRQNCVQGACTHCHILCSCTSVIVFNKVRVACDVTGSLDGKIRVWSILDSSVIATVQLHQDMVTAVSFSLSGGRVMAGTMRGRVRFYDLADGKLEYVAQVRGIHAAASIDSELVSGSPTPAGLLRLYACDVSCS